MNSFFLRSLSSGISSDILIIRNASTELLLNCKLPKGFTCFLKWKLKFVIVSTSKKMHLEFLKRKIFVVHQYHPNISKFNTHLFLMLGTGTRVNFNISYVKRINLVKNTFLYVPKEKNIQCIETHTYTKWLFVHFWSWSL